MPKASWAASDLVVQAASGLLYMTGEWDQPPLQLAPDQAALLGGVTGASAATLAASLGRRTGTVQYADIAMVETLASFAYSAVSQYVHHGEVTAREQRIKAGLRMVPAQDRFVYCAPGAVAAMRMDGIAELLSEPRLAEERFQTAEGRMQNWDEFVALFVPPFRTRTAQEWFERAEAMHMTFALVQTVDDLFVCPQLGARGLLRDVARTGRGHAAAAGTAVSGRRHAVAGAAARTCGAWVRHGGGGGRLDRRAHAGGQPGGRNRQAITIAWPVGHEVRGPG